jgi:DNA-binding GntR family transcriptional regulator
MLSGAYRPGERLYEGVIATELGVSKTPVREALASLRHSGLLERSNARVPTVIVVNTALIREVYQWRLIVEPAGVRLSAPTMRDENLSQARALLDTSARHGRAHDLVDLSKTNRMFHELMCCSCGNRYMLDALANMRDVIQFVAARGWLTCSSWDREWDEHAEILAAAERRDADHSAELMRRHIENAMERLTQDEVSSDSLPAASSQ